MAWECRDARPGGLGKFRPISEEEAKALKEMPRDLEPVGVPPAESEEPEVVE